jgi:hypothetical protein
VTSSILSPNKSTSKRSLTSVEKGNKKEDESKMLIVEEDIEDEEDEDEFLLGPVKHLLPKNTRMEEYGAEQKQPQQKAPAPTTATTAVPASNVCFI